MAVFDSGEAELSPTGLPPTCCHVPAFGVKGNADLSHDEDDVGIFW